MHSMSDHRKSKVALRIAIKIAIAILVGVIYYLLITYTPFSPKCYIRELTGLKCPGCGITHMFVDMFHLNFKQAFFDNAMVFIMWPFILAEIIYVLWLHEVKRDLPKWNSIVLYIYYGLLLGFMVVRNIFGF